MMESKVLSPRALMYRPCYSSVCAFTTKSKLRFAKFVEIEFVRNQSRETCQSERGDSMRLAVRPFRAAFPCGLSVRLSVRPFRAAFLHAFPCGLFEHKYRNH